jgi:hypothetical protein
MENNQNTGAGKGDKPRNCFSEQYRNNYDSIKWNTQDTYEEYSVCYDENGIEINRTNPRVVRNNL